MSAHIKMVDAKVNATREIVKSGGFVAEFVPALGKVGVNIDGTNYVLFDPDKATYVNGAGVPARGKSSHPIENMGSAIFNEIVNLGRTAKATLG